MTTPTADARQQRLDELLRARDRLNDRIFAMVRRELPHQQDWQQQAHVNRKDLADLVRILGIRHITHDHSERTTTSIHAQLTGGTGTCHCPR